MNSRRYSEEHEQRIAYAVEAIQEAYIGMDETVAAQIVEALKEPILAVNQCASKGQMQRTIVQLTIRNMALQDQLNKARRSTRTVTKVG